MGGRHRLKAGAPRLLGSHAGAAGRTFRVCYDALEVDFGPFMSPLVRLEAGRVAVAWVNLEAATRALAEARRQRDRGKGRRPNARQIERLSRRHGLADATYSTALDKLRALAAEARHSVTLDPAAILASALEGHDGR